MGSPDIAVTGGADSSSAAWLGRVLQILTTEPNGEMTIAALICALLIAVGYLSTRGGRSWSRARPWRILRIVFSPRYVLHRSHRLDILYYIANTKVIGLAIGWLLISGGYAAVVTHDALVAAFGAPLPAQWPAWAIMSVSAIVMFLAYEFGYWLDHYLSHRVAFLWEFHKVHHQAETLSPLTVFRVHPVDSLVFSNILALSMGPANGVLHFCFGIPMADKALFNSNLILLVFVHLVVQLQHSHVWIPFTGLLGRLFVSPAHHQIHHSDNPLHFNKNLGSCLAIFDWMFCTLHVPTRQREKLRFGVEPMVAAPHTLTEGLVAPFVRGGRHIVSWIGAGAAGVSGAAAAGNALSSGFDPSVEPAQQ